MVLGGTLGLAGTAFLSACGSSQEQDSAGQPSPSGKNSSASSSAKTFDPEATVSPAAEATEVNPSARVTVSVKAGKLDQVQVTGGTAAVEGKFSRDRKTWTSAGPLEFETVYTVDYTVERGGQQAQGQSSFTTVLRANAADASFNIKDGHTYGTGQIIELNFSEPVTERAAVEKAIKVTGGGNQPGRFRWYSEHKVRYRPKQKWAPNSTVNVEFPMFGMNIGNGQIGLENYSYSFRTGDTHYAVADDAASPKVMKAYINGVLARTMMVTMGDPEWKSVTGQLVIMEQAKKYSFDATTLGLKKGDSHWYEPFDATNTNRLTASGAFVHQAEPSAYPYVGWADISHGCIGLLPEDAEWFFDTFRVGDVVEAVNTGYPQANPDNGYGDWNIPWAQYANTSWKGNW